MLNLFIKLKKELLDLYHKLFGQILESNSFNVVKERYQSLSLLNQKFIKICFVSLFIGVMLYLPVYYLSSSVIAWMDLKQKQRLSLELLKTREQSSFSNMKETEMTLRSKIEAVVQKYSSENFTLLQESNKNLKSRPSIGQIVFKVEASSLNIRQAIQLGTELEGIAQVRFEEVSFKESEEYKNHYDIIYKLKAFIIKKDFQLKRKPRKRQGLKTEGLGKKNLNKRSPKAQGLETANKNETEAR